MKAFIKTILSGKNYQTNTRETSRVLLKFLINKQGEGASPLPLVIPHPIPNFLYLIKIKRNMLINYSKRKLVTHLAWKLNAREKYSSSD